MERTTLTEAQQAQRDSVLAMSKAINEAGRKYVELVNKAFGDIAASMGRTHR